MAKRTKEQQAALSAHFLAQFKDYQVQKELFAIAKKPLPVDPQLVALESKHTEAQKPIVIDPKLVQLRRDADLSSQQLGNKRLSAAQDLAWALINSSAFLFNH
jgi:putative ubiquitin-RnfH superfamily antitoxin RatB of RatAB toxin-antitoxin module